jgi:cation transport regulator ChaC
MHYFVFAYGSLMDAESASVTLGRLPVLTQARLMGYRTAWNVAAQINEGSHTDRTAHYADGGIYNGLIVPIGLERGDAYTTSGMLLEVTSAELLALDAREINYDRSEVTEQVEWLEGNAPNEPYIVYAYVPKPTSVEMLHRAADSGTKVVVMRSYIDLLQRAAQKYAYTIPTPKWEVQDITFRE